MGTTDNGYSAPPAEGYRPCGWDGAYAVPGVKDWDPVYEIFFYLMREYDLRVEWLHPGWCWGYAYRANANNPNSLSRHSGAIAVDLNAPLHPNGVSTYQTFTTSQRATVNNILDEIKCSCHGYRILRWGGDYTGTPDSMHFEINQPQACVVSAANKLKEGADTMDQNDKDWLKSVINDAVQPIKDATVRQTRRVMEMERKSAATDIRHAKLLKAIVQELDVKNPNRKNLEDSADALYNDGTDRLNAVNKHAKGPEAHE